MADKPTEDQLFLEFVVKALVDNPDKVSVARRIDEKGVLLTLSVSPDDMGKVIGKQGNTAKALRKLLSLFGAKNEERISLQIAEPEGSTRTIAEIASNDEEAGNDAAPTDEQSDESATSIL